MIDMLTLALSRVHVSEYLGDRNGGGAENAGVENAGVDSRGGKYSSGKSRSDNVWKAVKTENS